MAAIRRADRLVMMSEIAIGALSRAEARGATRTAALANELTRTGTSNRSKDVWIRLRCMASALGFGVYESGSDSLSEVVS